LRDGKPVTPEDIFRATQPLLRDLSPLFERVRAREEKRRIEGLCSELTRTYGLTETQQATLRSWLERKAEDDAKHYADLISNEHTTLEDMAKAARDVRPDDGIDGVMEGMLSGEKLEKFKADRIEQRADRVQQEADMKLARLDAVVGLDEAQRNQAFAIMARTSRDFDPAMRFEGVSEQGMAAMPAGGRQDALMAVLRPEQRQAYEQARAAQREEAAKDLQAIGLSLPPNWDMLDDEFR
jgi:hypothetical protein